MNSARVCTLCIWLHLRNDLKLQWCVDICVMLQAQHFYVNSYNEIVLLEEFVPSECFFPVFMFLS